jgi:predicted CoA-binding protein
MAVRTDDELRDILQRTETIAVVGCSSTPGKAAHDVPKYLLEQGYDVVPVNPYADEIFDRRTYDSLADVPPGVDVVDVFRPSEETGEIVDAAIERDDVDTIWLQLDITDDAAGERAESADKRFVQDRCLKVEHRRLQ